MATVLRALTLAVTTSIMLVSAAAAQGLAPQQACTGRDGSFCRTGNFCEFDIADQCGSGGRVGRCVRQPQVCNDKKQPVCGCDSVTYANDCKRMAVGVGKRSNGACPKPN